jgi:hypothetical protein
VAGRGDVGEQERRSGLHRHIEFRGIGGSDAGKIGWENSNDGEDLSVQGDRFSDGIGIAREMVFPPLMSDHDIRSGSGIVVSLAE